MPDKLDSEITDLDPNNGTRFVPRGDGTYEIVNTNPIVVVVQAREGDIPETNIPVTVTAETHEQVGAISIVDPNEPEQENNGDTPPEAGTLESNSIADSQFNKALEEASAFFKDLERSTHLTLDLSRDGSTHEKLIDQLNADANAGLDIIAAAKKDAHTQKPGAALYNFMNDQAILIYTMQETLEQARERVTLEKSQFVADVQAETEKNGKSDSYALGRLKTRVQHYKIMKTYDDVYPRVSGRLKAVHNEMSEIVPEFIGVRNSAANTTGAKDVPNSLSIEEFTNEALDSLQEMYTIANQVSIDHPAVPGSIYDKLLTKVKGTLLHAFEAIADLKIDHPTYDQNYQAGEDIKRIQKEALKEVRTAFHVANKPASELHKSLYDQVKARREALKKLKVLSPTPTQSPGEVLKLVAEAAKSAISENVIVRNIGNHKTVESAATNLRWAAHGVRKFYGKVFEAGATSAKAQPPKSPASQVPPVMAQTQLKPIGANWAQVVSEVCIGAVVGGGVISQLSLNAPTIAVGIGSAFMLGAVAGGISRLVTTSLFHKERKQKKYWLLKELGYGLRNGAFGTLGAGFTEVLKHMSLGESVARAASPATPSSPITPATPVANSSPIGQAKHVIQAALKPIIHPTHAALKTAGVGSHRMIQQHFNTALSHVVPKDVVHAARHHLRTITQAQMDKAAHNLVVAAQRILNDGRSRYLIPAPHLPYFWADKQLIKMNDAINTAWKFTSDNTKLASLRPGNNGLLLTSLAQIADEQHLGKVGHHLKDLTQAMKDYDAGLRGNASSRRACRACFYRARSFDSQDPGEARQ